MQERTIRLQQVILYGLIVIGILGSGFLVYVVVDHLSSDTPSIVSEPSPKPTPSVAVPPQPEEPSFISTGNRIGQRAPDFRLQSLDNNPVSLSDFLGKVVILDFWASWCGPCRQTMPTLEAIAQALASDVVLLGVNLDRTAEDAVNYLTSNGFDAMITLYESYAAALAVFRTYGSGNGIPRTLVIDRAGIIRFVGHPARLTRQTVEGFI